MEELNFIWHARALKALGPELVTNDLVAIIELVKNGYDAGAKQVNVIFEYDAVDEAITKGKYNNPYRIIISDNGSGMSYDDIKNKWFVIGTPNKEIENSISVDGINRYVSGSKGIGRLSAARLGNNLNIRTKVISNEELSFSVNWVDLFTSENLPSIKIQYSNTSSIDSHGTTIEIEEVLEEWSEEDVLELSDGLSRLISPFKPKTNFSIVIYVKNRNNVSKKFYVDYKKFLDKPVYKISGIVDKSGNIHGDYEYLPLGFKEIQRSKIISDSWENIVQSTKSIKRKESRNEFSSGEFTFEIRCWDIDSHSTEAITNLYDIKRSEVRKNIQYYKGISVYRDDILVLPKDESNRDWLGLDLRRISRVGDRISTNQIVGCINISISANPNLQDASDREGLAKNRAVDDFRVIILHIVTSLQIERSIDKVEKGPSITALFSNLNADELIIELQPYIDSGQISLPAIRIINKFADGLETKRKQIEKHFRYYGQLATLGQISALVLHEVRNTLMPIGGLMRKLRTKFTTFNINTQRSYTNSEKAIRRLENLTNSFTQLASRRQSKKGWCNVKESIYSVVTFFDKDVSENNIHFIIEANENQFVEINQAEFEIVLLNILMNAVYWIIISNKPDNRYIWIYLQTSKHNTQIEIIDNGPGVVEDEIELIFEPGVTRKPDGIGMGLPICIYFLEQNNGQLFYENRENESGAKFVIQLKNWEGNINESTDD